MVAPALPPGWCFAGATLLAAEVRARYAHEGSPRAHAELRLTHPDASVEGARTERVRARLLSPQRDQWQFRFWTDNENTATTRDLALAEIADLAAQAPQRFPLLCAPTPLSPQESPKVQSAS